MRHMTILNLLPSRAVAVIGAGAMGSGIAQVAAQAGHEVYLVDAFEGAAAAARDRLASMLARLAVKGRITLAEADAATPNIHVTDSSAHHPECALVIEAIRENLDDKRALFAAVARSQPA